MKPLLLSTYDISGGAARSAYRLHQGLQEIGLPSQMLVQNRRSDDRTVIGPLSKLDQTLAFLRPGLDSLPLSFYRHRQSTRFSLNWVRDQRLQQIQTLNPDLINLHWLGSGALQLETLARFKKPIVWTLHDMWAFTGGCHYTDGCDRYLQSCGKCPQLGSHRQRDLSHWNWQRRRQIFQRLDLTIVTPSQWLATCARQSPLLQNQSIEVIPYGLDLTVFQPRDRKMLRSLLGLPLDKPLILFGASDATSDRRKGFHLLEAALQQLRALAWEVLPEIIIFGASHGKLDCGFPVHYLGVLQDELMLAIAYGAVDIFVAPSIQDNLPNTVLEATACGTPTVAFDIGGMPDLIQTGQTGYLAQPFEPDDLARGITIALQNSRQWGTQAGAIAAERYGLTTQAQAYQRLFTQILARTT